MIRSIKSSRGTQIGRMRISHDRVYNENTILKDINVEFDGKEKELKLPKYGKVDTIDTFGLPPFNEWAVGVENIEELSENFSIDNHEEAFESKVIGPLTGKIRLERKFESKKEAYQVHEIGSPNKKSIIGSFDIESSNGNCSIVIDRDINHSRDQINRLRKQLTEKEKKYLRDVRREERLPDVVVLKTMKIDGEAPVAKMEMYPFWEKRSYDEEKVRSLEIGYLNYGDNDTDFDKKHGKWYKLMSFEDFDHERLEIREGNWQSTEVKVKREKRQTLDHYEKYLFKR